MTEIYNGPWSPLYGDRPKHKAPEPDSYHRYPTKPTSPQVETAAKSPTAAPSQPQGQGS